MQLFVKDYTRDIQVLQVSRKPHRSNPTSVTSIIQANPPPQLHTPPLRDARQKLRRWPNSTFGLIPRSGSRCLPWPTSDAVWRPAQPGTPLFRTCRDYYIGVLSGVGMYADFVPGLLGRGRPPAIGDAAFASCFAARRSKRGACWPSRTVTTPGATSAYPRRRAGNNTGMHHLQLPAGYDASATAHTNGPFAAAGRDVLAAEHKWGGAPSPTVRSPWEPLQTVAV